jgi:hypothetical protein
LYYLLFFIAFICFICLYLISSLSLALGDYHYWDSPETPPWEGEIGKFMPNGTDENGVNFFRFIRLLLRYFCRFDVEGELVSDESDIAKRRLANWLVLVGYVCNFDSNFSGDDYRTDDNLQVDLVQSMSMKLHYLFSHFSQIR